MSVTDLARYTKCSPADLSPAEVNGYFEHLVIERDLAPASCRLFFHGIRFLYIQVLHWPEADLSIVLPKRPQRIPQLLTHSEVARILVACEEPRYKMMLTLCYGCGLRVSELLAVQVDHLDGERRLLHVEQGKGATDRLMPLSETLLEQLRCYWRRSRPRGWLFPGRSPGRPLCCTSVQKAYTLAKRKAEITKNGGIHSLRHAYATHLLQAVIAACLDGYSQNHRLSPRQWQVCRHVLDCRTAALGGLALRCDNCAAETPMYYACRDRHCPRCQRLATEAWCEKQRAAVLPVTYHHLVFTLPHVLNPWIEIHDRVIYGLLFEAVWATLSAFATDPKRLDGQLGMTAVLHTWGQTLMRHVHLHCLVPGGALSEQGQWNPATSTYLFPVRALSRHVRGGFVSRLRQAINDGRLKRIKGAAQIDAMLDALMGTEWVVYSKPCLCRTETVVDYLGRYSHRIALSDARVLNLDNGEVELAYKDYRDGDNKVMSLSVEELLRRFLLHVLPKGFMRIRHFGFLANRCRGQRLEQIRTAIKAKAAEIIERTCIEETPDRPCPKCRRGRLRVVGEIAPRAWAGADSGG